MLLLQLVHLTFKIGTRGKEKPSASCSFAAQIIGIQRQIFSHAWLTTTVAGLTEIITADEGDLQEPFRFLKVAAANPNLGN